MSNHQRLVDDFRKAMFVDHDPEAIARCYSEDAIMTDPNHPTPLRGARAIADYHASFLRAFPDLSGETINVFGSGEWLAAEFRVTGTHTGPLDTGDGHPLPPTGQRIDLRVCWIGRMTPDGRCSEDRSYFDNTAFAHIVQGAPT
jgi:predicted ester cyclase